MLEQDDEAETHRQQTPVERRELAVLVPEATVPGYTDVSNGLAITAEV